MMTLRNAAKDCRYRIDTYAYECLAYMHYDPPPPPGGEGGGSSAQNSTPVLEMLFPQLYDKYYHNVPTRQI